MVFVIRPKGKGWGGEKGRRSKTSGQEEFYTMCHRSRNVNLIHIYVYIYTYLYLYIYPSLFSILLWMFKFYWTLDSGIVLWTIDIFENELFFHERSCRSWKKRKMGEWLRSFREIKNNGFLIKKKFKSFQRTWKNYYFFPKDIFFKSFFYWTNDIFEQN